MFRDEPIKYPDNNPVLGRFLGPEIDVGPEMTANIMKGNGEVAHRSTYRGLKEYVLAELTDLRSPTQRYSICDFPLQHIDIQGCI